MRILVLLVSILGCGRPAAPPHASVADGADSPPAARTAPPDVAPPEVTPPDAAPPAVVRAARGDAGTGPDPQVDLSCCRLIRQCEARFPVQADYLGCLGTVRAIAGCDRAVRSLSKDVDLCSVLPP